jgi:hypothetical protein
VRAARRGSPARRRSGWTFLLWGALPAAAVVWFLLQPEPTRRSLLERLPPGAGGRAIAAGVALGVLVVLARVALPAFHAASGALLAARGRLRSRTGVLRVILFPVEAVLWLLWLAAQILFAVDAVLVIAAGLLTLLLSWRILQPDALPGLLPDLRW